ncbi:MAG TPA: glutathione S-transferase family protein [Candidatus Binatia bacterium]|jgi:glutathione S-transferase
MNAPVRIVGSYLSPYVRKVLVVLGCKGIAYEIDPIVPFFGDDRFAAASPLRRVPVYIDERVTLCDSSVICQYLEDAHPTPPLYPGNVAERARARWLEEFADTRMGDVFIWRLFNQVAIGPAVWGRPVDKELVRKTIEEDIPTVLDYLESQAPADGYFSGLEPSIADISVAAFFRNAAFARYVPDAGRWPRACGVVARTLATHAFAALVPFEELCIRTPVAKHREALAAIGAPLTRESWGTEKPRAGLMSI